MTELAQCVDRLEGLIVAGSMVVAIVTVAALLLMADAVWSARCKECEHCRRKERSKST